MKLTTLAAAATALALTLGGIVAASAAYATGSDSTTPYTVDASGITLPPGSVFEDGGHINIRTDRGDRGIHLEAKCVPRTDAECAGEAHAVALLIGQPFAPWDVFTLPASFCVTWVQIAGFNEHFGEGGQSPICVGTTPPATPTETSTPTWTPTETPTSTPPSEPTQTPTATPSPTTPSESPSPSPTSAPTSPSNQPSATSPAVMPLSPNSPDAARFAAPSPAGSGSLAATGDDRLIRVILLGLVTVAFGVLILAIGHLAVWRSRR